MANRQRDPGKEQFWRRILARFRASGLRIRDFCERENLPEPSFYAWRAELARRDHSQARVRQTASGAARRGLKPSTFKTAPAFVPVHVLAQERESADDIDIMLGDGRVVRVRPGFDHETLTRVLAVLEAGPC